MFRFTSLMSLAGKHLTIGTVDLYVSKHYYSFLDSEQRIIASKVIKRSVFILSDIYRIYMVCCQRFILHAKKTAFIIEHDFIMATYLADRVIVFEGRPAVSATATPYATQHTLRP
jgi:ATP-binding cassette, sub-family E, member 1